MKQKSIFLICTLVFGLTGAMPFAVPRVMGETKYNPGDVQAINRIIINNGLNWTQASPSDGTVAHSSWTGVTWSNDATNKRITSLSVNGKSLTGTLNVTALTALKYFYCYSNKLAAINVAGLTSLISLYCYDNPLSSLSVSGLTNLEDLACQRNQLAVLNVSTNTVLEHLSCGENQLTALDLSKNTALTHLVCTNNHLTALDLTGLSINSFTGNGQTSSLALTWNNATSRYEGTIELNTPTKLTSGISYADGKLISTDNTIASTIFRVKTGASSTNITLDGTIALTYIGGNAFVPVTDITGVPATATAGTPLNLAGTVVPSNATNQTITWTVTDAGSTGATVTDNILYTTAAGTVSVTATIANGAALGTDYTQDFTITVSPAADVTAPVLSAGTVNRTSDVAATVGFTTNEAGTAYYLAQAGGSAAPTNAQVKAGTSLGSVSAGAASGLSITLTAGAQDIYIVVEDAAGNISAPLEIAAAAYVPPVPPAITTTTLPNATVGAAYSQTLTATGDAPIAWSITAGNLPAGLLLDAATGVISGTPTTAGTANFTVQATNGAGNDTKALSITTGADITTEFSDLNFLACVRTALGKGASDNIYDTDDFASVTSLSVSDRNIASLDGIGRFTALTSLNCKGNRLTSLPALPDGLTKLYCYNNQLSALPTTLPTGLTLLDCSQNQLTTLPTLPAGLTWLSCNNNQLAGILDVSGLSSLTSLNCSQNRLTGVTLKSGVSWTELDVRYNYMTATSDVTGYSGTWDSDPAYFTPQYTAGFHAVTNITGVPATTTAGGRIILKEGNSSRVGTVVPSDATNKAINWSIKSAGTTGATIGYEIVYGYVDGVLTPSTIIVLYFPAAGTLVLTATIANGAAPGTDYTQDFTITVSPAADVTAPVLSAGTVNRTSDVAATVGFTTDEAGTAYYLAQAGGSAAPTNALVKAGTSLGSVSAGAASGLSVTLTAGAQDIYIVVEDAAGNISVPLKIVAAAYVPPVSPAITTATLPNATVGAAYSQTLTATGDAPITWSITAGNLPAGLSLNATGVISGTPTTAGTANFTVQATNSAGNDTKALSITTVSAVPTYGVSIGTFTGGTVTASKTANIVAGETVTLTITPARNYELYHISACKTGDAGTSVTLSGTGASRTFTMPAYGVTVTATFRKTADQMDVETAQSLIEGVSYTVAQAAANTLSAAKSWLVSRINALSGMSATGITVTTADISISNFRAATAGTSGNPSGANGSFRFSVSLAKGSSYSTASNSGTIIATVYVAPATYAVTIEGSANGTVTASPTVATAGTTVSLTLTPAEGYEPEILTVFATGNPAIVVVETQNFASLQSSQQTYAFRMPAYPVTVRATFRKTQEQLNREAIETAKAAIEGGVFRVAQTTANDAESIRTWLVGTLGVLFGQSHGLQLRSSETPVDAVVSVTALTPATAGTEEAPAGVNGSFTFTVALTKAASVATATFATGVIVATPHASVPVKRIELLYSPGSLTVRIVSTGNTATGDLTLVLAGNRSEAFTLSPSSPGSLPAGGEANIVLTPDADLTPGAYALTLTVSAEDLMPVSISITYTVMPVGTERVESSTLRIAATGDGFWITGLIPGETLSIYNMQGQLLHKSKADATEQRISLRVRGIYIVVNGERTVKAVY